MSILIGTTKKIAVRNDASDPSSSIITATWHTPIIRAGANGGKISQPGTNGIAIRWNLARGDMSLNNRTGIWTGKTITQFNTALNAGDVSPAGAKTNLKISYNSSTYPWAQNISVINGIAGVRPDYIQYPKSLGEYINDLVIDMFVTSSATGTQYSVGQFINFGVALQVATSFDVSGTFTRLLMDSSKFSSKQYGNTGAGIARYSGTTTKSEQSIPLFLSNNLFIVPFITANGGVFQASSEYITDILIGIKLTR